MFYHFKHSADLITNRYPEMSEESQSYSVAFSGEEDDTVCCAGSCCISTRQAHVSTCAIRHFFLTSNL